MLVHLLQSRMTTTCKTRQQPSSQLWQKPCQQQTSVWQKYRHAKNETKFVLLSPVSVPTVGQKSINCLLRSSSTGLIVQNSISITKAYCSVDSESWYQQHYKLRCRQRARLSTWWPGLSTQLTDYVRRCTVCVRKQTQHAEPLISFEPSMAEDRSRFLWVQVAHLPSRDQLLLTFCQIGSHVIHDVIANNSPSPFHLRATRLSRRNCNG